MGSHQGIETSQFGFQLVRALSGQGEDCPTGLVRARRCLYPAGLHQLKVYTGEGRTSFIIGRDQDLGVRRLQAAEGGDNSI
jgi:hypothetical protein